MLEADLMLEDQWKNASLGDLKAEVSQPDCGLLRARQVAIYFIAAYARFVWLEA